MDRVRVAGGMALRLGMSSLLLFMLVGFSVLVAQHMLDELFPEEGVTYGITGFRVAGISFCLFGIALFGWALSRLVKSCLTLRRGEYSPVRTVRSSGVLCVFLSLGIVANLSSGDKYQCYFCVALAAYMVYEGGLVIYVRRHSAVFPMEPAGTSELISEYVEESCIWDELLKQEAIEPISEEDDLYHKYCNYRKDQLAELLECPENYSEKAVKTAKYVYYNRYCR